MPLILFLYHDSCGNPNNLYRYPWISFWWHCFFSSFFFSFFLSLTCGWTGYEQYCVTSDADHHYDINYIIYFMPRASFFSLARIEPLLSRIKEDHSTVLCPIIDAIDDNTLEYSSQGGYQIGGFSWSLHFTWLDEMPRNPSNYDYTNPIGYGQESHAIAYHTPFLFVLI